MNSNDPASFVPLPHLALHVLMALSDQDRHGWAIVRRIEEMTEGVWSPSAGSLYLSMVGLEKKGLIGDVPTPDAGTDGRRRYYTLKPLGRRVLEIELQRMASLVSQAGRLGDGGQT